MRKTKEMIRKWCLPHGCLLQKFIYAINVTYLGLGLLFVIGRNLNVYAENLVTSMFQRGKEQQMT